MQELMKGANESPMTPIQRTVVCLGYTVVVIILLASALQHRIKELFNFNDEKEGQVPPAAIKTPAQADPNAPPAPLHPTMIPTGQ